MMSSQQEYSFKTTPQETLSHNSLYASLSDKVRDGSLNSTDIRGKKRSEKSLYTFLQRVSVYHHQQLSCSSNGNKGSQNVTVSQIEKSLARRALTLIGGGIHNDLAPSTAAMVESSSSHDINPPRNSKTRKRKSSHHRVHGSISNRQRKRILNNKRDNSLPSSKQNKLCSVVETSILQALNEMWNNYLSQLLLLNNKDMKSFSWNEKQGCHNFNTNHISTHICNAELVGACIQVVSCNSHRKYEGRNGVILQMTKNTWKIALSCANKNTMSRKLCTVPRKGTLLSLRITVNMTCKEQPFVLSLPDKITDHENIKHLRINIRGHG